MSTQEGNSNNQSKTKILQTAFKLFGERSPEDVSIRELAKAAGVNIASIHYYYGSKEALYLAVVQDIADMMAQKRDEFSKAYEKALKESDKTDEFYIYWTKRLLEEIAYTILGKLKENNYMHRIMIREQMMPSKGFDLLYEKGLKKALNTLDELVANITRQDISSDEVKIRAHTLIGQIAIFGVQQNTVAKRVEFSNKRYEQNLDNIIKIILENCEYLLRGLIAQRNLS